jgi:signal transduction histidine kinase
VSLSVEGDDLVVEVYDDGHGFDPEAHAGIGLRSMRERTAALGGKLEIESNLGEGTRVRLQASMRGILQGGSEAEAGASRRIDEGGK